jgi:hypothetical protein
MTRRAMRNGLISEVTIKEALRECKGDLFLAACALDCTPRELDVFIRRSAELQNFAAALEQVKIDPSYARMSAEQFENQLANLTQSLRVVGLENIAKLATMEFGDSGALAKVKLDAAIALRGSDSRGAGNDEMQDALRDLNALYHQNAPRIKEIRQTVITMKDDREVTLPVIELKPNR